MSPVEGLHHVTAITGSARENLRFYRDGLGLRFVKKTVNFDDPGTYHLYYGDELGRPGTILTFFAWEALPRGTRGAHDYASVSFAVPEGSLDEWTARLAQHGADVLRTETLHGQERLVATDPDGMGLILVATPDVRAPWTSPAVGKDLAVTGLAGVGIVVASTGEREGLARVLTDGLGYAASVVDGAVTRFVHPKAPVGATVDVTVAPEAAPARHGVGTIHHVAFSVPDRAAQLETRRILQGIGLQPTPPIDRDYFMAIYARAPGGVLVEVATAEPGFAVDEAPDQLGSGLKLPKQHEHLRARLNDYLPPLA